MTKPPKFTGTTEKEYRAWWRRYAPKGVKYGECWCGCGTVTDTYKRTRRHIGYLAGCPRRIIKGHGEYTKAAYNERRRRLYDAVPYEYLTDTEIAEDLGVSRYHVKKERLKRGHRRAKCIPGSFEVPVKLQILTSPGLMHQLGTVPDTRIAKELACSNALVSRIRNALDIPNRRTSAYVRNAVPDSQLVALVPDRVIAQSNKTTISTVRRERRFRGLVKRGNKFVHCEVCGKTAARWGSHARYCSKECLDVAKKIMKATQCRPESLHMTIALEIRRARKELRDAE